MTKPGFLNPLAEDVLQRLSARKEASEIILGGYFALQHYTDYRQTHDIHAGWKTRASKDAEEAIRSVMTEVATEKASELGERHFGDTLSFELHQGGKTQFSFQISVRSVALEEPVTSAWPPILIETLHDNVGSKMNALVNRGAPRDFLDISHVVQKGLLSVGDCWNLWARKNKGQTIESARQKVLLAIEALESKRPLEGIGDPDERKKAREVRDWYRNSFLKE